MAYQVFFEGASDDVWQFSVCSFIIHYRFTSILREVRVYGYFYRQMFHGNRDALALASWSKTALAEPKMTIT